MNVICNRSCTEPAADGSMELTLTTPLDKAYPADTTLHFHSEGPGLYAACNEKDPGTEWEKVSCSIGGIQTAPGIPPQDKWWIGTKYAKLRFVVATGDRAAKVQLRNIKLTVEF